MERTGRGVRPVIGMVLSVLVAAAVLVVAVLGPGWWSAPPDVVPQVRGPVAADPAGLRQAALVDAEDARLREIVRAVPYGAGPYLDRAHGPAVLVLPRRAAAYALGDLVALGAARADGAGAVRVTADVLVAPGGRLVLDAPGTEIRLAGNRSVTAWRSDLVLRGAPGRPVTVTSWDETTGGIDREPADGRAHLRVLGGRLDSSQAELAGLGFWSGRTGGLAVTGVAGEPGSAVVRSTTVRDGWYGLYVDDSTDVTVEASRFTGHAADGVRLHRGVRDASVRRVESTGNAGAGVAVGRGASDVTVADVTTSANAVGVTVDGAPLADGPGPSGASPAGFAGFSLERIGSRDDRDAGVVVDGGTDVLIADAVVTGALEGVVVRGGAADVRVLGARVSGPVETGVAVRDGATGVLVRDGVVEDAGTGVAVRDATARILDTTVTRAGRHAVSVAGAAHGTEVRGDRFVGSGPSAVDVARVSTESAVTVVGNDESGWTVRRDPGEVVSGIVGHPLVPLWLAVGLALVLALWSRRRSRGGPGSRAPYPGRPQPAPVPLTVRSSARTPAGPRLTVLVDR